MLEIDNLMKYFMTIFIGIIISVFLSHECLLQPNIVDIEY
jgi:hypothetical protein